LLVGTNCLEVVDGNDPSGKPYRKIFHSITKCEALRRTLQTPDPGKFRDGIAIGFRFHAPVRTSA
jgi:hypothetical protein